MTLPTLPRAIWTGVIDDVTYRVVDFGAAAVDRLHVEQLGSPDRLGAARWTDLDPIPRRVFERMLIAARVVT